MSVLEHMVEAMRARRAAAAPPQMAPQRNGVPESDEVRKQELVIQGLKELIALTKDTRFDRLVATFRERIKLCRDELEVLAVTGDDAQRGACVGEITALRQFANRRAHLEADLKAAEEHLRDLREQAQQAQNLAFLQPPRRKPGAES